MLSRTADLAKNTLILTVGRICTQFISFLLLPLYTRLLVPEEYGIVDLFSTYVSLLVPIFGCQFDSGLFRFVIDCRNNEQQKKTVISTVFSAILFQVGICILFYFLVQHHIENEYKVYILINTVLNIFQNDFMQLARGLGKNLVYAIGSFLSATATIFFNILFIVLFNMGAFGMFNAGVIAQVITIIFLITVLKFQKLFSIKNFNKQVFCNVLKYSLPLIPNQLSWWVVSASDRVVISHFINYAANGIYSVANKFSNLYITFYNIFNLSWTESVSLHIDDIDRDYFFTNIINKILKLLVSMSIMIICCIPFVIHLIGEEYADAYYHIPILMIAALFQTIVGLFSAIYVGLKKSIQIAKTSLFAAIINLTIDLLLIQKIGMYAASISTFIAYTTMAVYRFIDLKKYVNIMLDMRTIKIYLVMLVCTLIVYYTDIPLFTLGYMIIMVIISLKLNKDFIFICFSFLKKKFFFRS